MMFRDPKHDHTPEETPSPDGENSTIAPDPWLYCRACGHAVTRPEWQVTLDGQHVHHGVNPLGITYKVRLFSDAPGVQAMGTATSKATWFAGYAWRVVGCGECRDHLGWFYEGAGKPASFFGLIADALTETPR